MQNKPNAVRIPVDGAVLNGDLTLQPSASGVVVFAHGSGSSRHSPRNRAVAASLQERGLGTLLMDLLTNQEEMVDEQTRQLRFDIELLAERLVAAMGWLHLDDRTRDMKIGLFGASTGAGAALFAAAARPQLAQAVVSRGGRPDLAGPALASVRCPTLLIVGEYDEQVIDLNREAMEKMAAPTRLVIVPRATHLFEEPGAIDDVARLAGDWFTEYLAPGPQEPGSVESSMRGGSSHVTGSRA